jgi:hypothetical protein
MSVPLANTNSLQHTKAYWIKFVFSIVLFLISGFVSTWLCFRYQDSEMIFWPGLLYTSTTILVFLLTGKSFTIRKLLIYYLLMNLTYIVLFLLTWLSSYFGIITGIIAGGIGALVTFRLTERFITPIRFKRSKLFIAGGLAFLVTEMLYIFFRSILDNAPFEYFSGMESSVSTLFAEVYIFWHPMVGTMLCSTLLKEHSLPG